MADDDTRTFASNRRPGPLRAAAHLRERSIDLLPRNAVLAGVDEETALVKGPDGWSVAGAGAVTLYGAEGTSVYAGGAVPAGLLPD